MPVNEPIKLNIGAGATVIEGFTPIDRKLGSEAYPLPYPDGSISEIRASHILEHFTFGEASKVLAEWTRVLMPGGRMRISVPDVDKVLNDRSGKRLFYLMGGQTDEDDIHKSAYDRKRLTALMTQCGLTGLKDWTSANTDTASHEISLNLEGTKADATVEQYLDLKVGAYMSLPRYESVAARTIIERALKPLKIDLTTTTGVFWGQCMQRMFQGAVEKELDWILTIDYDSVFSSTQLSRLMETFATHPEIDALAALQCRRGTPYPLMTTGKNAQDDNVEIDGSPVKVVTAHFGLTLIRVDSLKKTPKPWFYAEPEKNGDWGDGRLDDDIWFWHQWRLAGHTIYVAPNVSIGHVEETVACFDEHLNPQHLYVSDWRKQNKGT